MYVYVSDKWNIILKTMNKRTGLQNKYREYIVNYSMSDNLIYENWQVIRYENSKQWEEDTNKYHLNKELEETKRKNEELTAIANSKVRKEMELDTKKQWDMEYQRKLYFLKNMRWSQHL